MSQYGPAAFRLLGEVLPDLGGLPIVADADPEGRVGLRVGRCSASLGVDHRDQLIEVLLSAAAPHDRLTLLLDRLEAELAAVGYDRTSLMDIVGEHVDKVRGVVAAHGRMADLGPASRFAERPRR